MAYSEKKRRNFVPWRGSGKAKRDSALAKQSFENRSKRSQSQDLHKFADIAPNITVYLKAPCEWDWPGVDTPSKLAELTRKGNVELVVKDSSKKDKLKTHRYKIKKKDANKELKKKQELAKADVVMFNVPLAEKGHKLPTEKEILAEAQRLYQKENFKAIHNESMPEQMPTKGELQEEGLLNAAKLNLMTSQDTQASRSVLDYVDGLRQQLEKIGFTVEPIAGFDVSDIQY
jgi:hypothetical protein